MPLQSIKLKPGVNRENTRLTNEGGYYESDKVRFRQGTPEKIGGWTRISANTFLGVCRSLWNWVTLSYQNLLGVGTNTKFYIENGGVYNDITPIRTTTILTNPFATTSGLSTVTVTDATVGYDDGDYVSFYGATAVGGLTLNGEYQITYSSGTTYTINAGANASSTATGGGTVSAVYQANVGPAFVVPLVGWGAGTWGAGAWGVGTTSNDPMRLWNQMNFGQDLLYGPRGGPLYYWNANVGYQPSTVSITIAAPAVVSCTLGLSAGTAITLQTTGQLPTGLSPGVTYYVKYIDSTSFNLSATYGGASITTTGTQSGVHSVSPRGIKLSELAGANEVPLSQNYFLVSDASRFIILFGTNDIYSTTFDPMLVRWSDQENATEWAPAVTNQAGSIKLSHGSEIITAVQSRQEILVLTDSALYSLQYLGVPVVWSSQILADNISIAGPNAVALASGVTYWMGVDKFYKYDGRTQTMRCDLRQFIYNDINLTQKEQIFASTNEGFNEVWFFYPSSGSTVIDRYVVYNYSEDIWYYGTMGRTAWLDSGLRDFPMAATYSNNIVYHENGVDDDVSGTPTAMESYITSSQFDIGDGHNFAFVWRMLPDLTFRGSTAGTTPSLEMQLQPLKNSGSGYTNPKSVGGVSSTATGTVTATQTYPIDLDTFTGQLNIRIRARQMSMRIYCNTLGTQWQLGAPRIDMRPDGRR